MKISVQGKLDELGANIDILDGAIKEVLELQVGQLASAARGEWIRLAQNRLGTSRDLYINGLRQSESFRMLGSRSNRVYEIALVGIMPNNIEFGMSSFDMKGVRPGWLGGKASKMGKNGKRYVIIPFRHSTTNSHRFAYTGKAKSVNDPDLKSQLKKTVKTYGLDRMIRTATGKVITGTVARLPKNAPVHPYLQGLVRTQQASNGVLSSGKQRGSGSLLTFRVMSENSSPDSWIHPGLTAVNLLAEVESFVDNEMSKIVKNVLGVGS